MAISPELKAVRQENMAKARAARITAADADRVEGCPSVGTARTCGRAYTSGCRNAVCLQGYKDSRDGKPIAPRKKATMKTDAKPKVLKLSGFAKHDKSSSPNWILHTPECCASVWRMKSWGCIK